MDRRDSTSMQSRSSFRSIQSRVSIRTRFFRALARLSVEHPWLVLGAAFVLSVLSILYTKARLEFRTGQDDLISGNSRDSPQLPSLQQRIPRPRRPHHRGRGRRRTGARRDVHRCAREKTHRRQGQRQKRFLPHRYRCVRGQRPALPQPRRTEDAGEANRRASRVPRDLCRQPEPRDIFLAGECRDQSRHDLRDDVGIARPRFRRTAKSQSKLDLTMLNGVLTGMLAPPGTRFVSPGAA